MAGSVRCVNPYLGVLECTMPSSEDGLDRTRSRVYFTDTLRFAELCAVVVLAVKGDMTRWSAGIKLAGQHTRISDFGQPRGRGSGLPWSRIGGRARI